MNLMYGLILCLFSLVISCSRTESKSPFVHVNSTQPGVAAKFSGIIIQDSEVVKGIESDLYEEESKIYQMKMESLKNIIALKLMEKDSKSKGLDKNQYFEKYVYKNVSDADVDAFIKERNLPKEQITPDIRERIRTVIQAEKNAKSVETWISKEMGSNTVEVFPKT